MSDPVIEQIAKAVVARLETIAAGVTNAAGLTYQVTPTRVYRPTRLDETADANGTLLVKQADYGQDIENNAQGNPPSIAQIVAFGVRIFVTPDEDDTAPIDSLINTWRSDIESALMLDPQWGGLAYNTMLLPPERFFDGNGAESGIDVMIEIYYAVSENDPYTNRSA
jgi:hypothetical protein